MLTEQELNKIFSWLPYRETWIVDEKGKVVFYNDLIHDFTSNQHFETFYSQDGGMTNYLEFFCYPINHNVGKTNAIIVCVSLCAPFAAYGQTMIHYMNSSSIGHDFLKIENVSIVVDKELLPIEREVKAVLNKHNVSLIEKDFANRELPSEVAENMENLNEGTKYLHGLFQWTD